MADKVSFNLLNVHYAKKTDSGYGVVRAIPGATEITLEPISKLKESKYDGLTFWASNAKQGYRGRLTVAALPDIFKTEIFGQGVDEYGVMIERTDDLSSPFALAFQIDGDSKGSLWWFYNCWCDDIPLESETNAESKNINTVKLSIVCVPDERGVIRAKAQVPDPEPITPVNGWFSQVYEIL